MKNGSASAIDQYLNNTSKASDFTTKAWQASFCNQTPLGPAMPVATPLGRFTNKSERRMEMVSSAPPPYCTLCPGLGPHPSQWQSPGKTNCPCPLRSGFFKGETLCHSHR